jgi:SAM-dependent methyltransferase
MSVLMGHSMAASSASAGAVSPGQEGPRRSCRGCGAPLWRMFVDLGVAPPCEDFLTPDRLLEPEVFYPLDVRICDSCLLVQLPSYVSPNDIFREYAYFSSYSDSWVAHAAGLVDEAVRRQDLGPGSRVVEVASNDGYLLQHVVARGIQALGIEPARNVAAVAQKRGIPTITEFLTLDLARQIAATHGQADCVVANNVWAHIPDLNDFTAGLAVLLAPSGLMSIEVAYLVDLIEGREFDTIYHEHFMYYTVLSAERVLRRQGLRLLDVELLKTHGGSIRLWVVHDEDPRTTTDTVAAIKARERAAGLGDPSGYAGFAAQVTAIKLDLLEFLVAERKAGRRIVGYGAPGKANTLLNYCGIRTGLIQYLVDKNPYKQGRYTPGSHIPIHAPERIDQDRPDVILILPWNLRDEIAEQLAYTRAWGARLVVPIPRLQVL